LRLPQAFLLLVFCLLPLFLFGGEIRAIWVLPWSITNPNQIDKVIADALAAGQTDLFVEVRYRSDALYIPNRVPDDYPNPEVRSYILADNGFDPLDYTLRKAQAQKLRVHAWVVVFNATPTHQSYLQNNYIYRKHYEWITHDSKGRKMNSGEQFGYFIDPGVPAVQDHVLNVLSDLVSGYPQLDGLHLDYIRYPSSEWGYHPISVQRYENYIVQYGPKSWNQWRTLQITEFVEKIYRQVKKISPALIVSAAVFSNYDDATISYAQDWKDWLDRGIVDCLYPMAYHVDLTEFGRQLDFMKSLGQDCRFVIGIRAWDANGGSLLPSNHNAFAGYTINNIFPRIDIVRSFGFAGVALFSYDGLIKENALAQLAAVSFRHDIIEKVDAARNDFTIDVTPSDLEKPFAADFKVTPSGRQYVLNLLIPEEGNWFWEIWDKADKLLFQRNRYYPRGSVKDFWNGSLNSEIRIDPGAYIVRVYPENGKYQYYIPISLEALNR